MLLGLSWSYARDTRVCREQRENLHSICADLARIQLENSQNTDLPIISFGDTIIEYEPGNQ